MRIASGINVPDEVVEVFPSIDGFWKKAVTFPNGDHLLFTVTNDDGTPRTATLAEIEDHHGRCEPPWWVVFWWSIRDAWFQISGKARFEEDAPF